LLACPATSLLGFDCLTPADGELWLIVMTFRALDLQETAP